MLMLTRPPPQLQLLTYRAAGMMYFCRLEFIVVMAPSTKDQWGFCIGFQIMQKMIRNSTYNYHALEPKQPNLLLDVALQTLARQCKMAVKWRLISYTHWSASIDTCCFITFTKNSVQLMYCHYCKYYCENNKNRLRVMARLTGGLIECQLCFQSVFLLSIMDLSAQGTLTPRFVCLERTN